MATFRLCSIPDCGKRARYRNYCDAHHGRWKRNGDPLGGRPNNVGAPWRYYYETVLTYEGDECLTWPFAKSHGYARLNNKPGPMLSVTRLACEHVNGPPPSPIHEAAHSCGKGHLGCVTKKHLSWKTPKENLEDCIAHGTRLWGENRWNSKLTENQVRQILALRGIMTQQEIARMMGVGQDHISRIQTRKVWAWLSI